MKCKLVMSVGCSLGHLGCNGSVSVSVLLSSGNSLEMSHSSGSGSVSSDGFDGPTVSSLGGSSTGGSGLSLLEMEVRFSTNSTDSVRVAVLFTSGWSSSCH